MAMKSRLDINPVFNHKKSIALVDTAEDLVDSLDKLSVCLKHIEEKHLQNKEISESSSLYETLRENLEVAQDLTDTLKREKWRLSRRQMSIELRMGELEEYKSHLKKDMTDMNITVESLSMRIIELENALVEAQEIQELTEAERDVTQKRLDESEKTIKELEEKREKMADEIRQLRLERKDVVLKRQNSELVDRIEILTLENRSLKELIRQQEDLELIQESVMNNSNASVSNGPKDKEKTESDSSVQYANKKEENEQSSSSSRSAVLTETTEIAYV